MSVSVQSNARPEAAQVTMRLATANDREAIYRIRHDVYAVELGQHGVQPDARLSDALDASNLYVVAEVKGVLAGFVSLTPPGSSLYSLDKYFPRAKMPFAFDSGLYEVRLLTVTEPFRRTHLAHLLMLAALEIVKARGGTHIAAIGRAELMAAYRDAGLDATGITVKSGAVTFELMHAEVAALEVRAARFRTEFPALLARIHWQEPPVSVAHAIHGGQVFDRLGRQFQNLDQRGSVVPADILDAWFDPAPKVLDLVRDNLPWALKASPPTGAEGLLEAIAASRGIESKNLVAGGGSSTLIHLALRHWLKPTSRVLILDPTYSEYPHLLELVGCRVDTLALDEADGFRLDAAQLREALARGYDWVLLVNPNNPTGHAVDAGELRSVLAAAPSTTRFWLDETYIDYAQGQPSMEAVAAASSKVIVCKSMSKAYALSGARVAYLCGSEAMMNELRPLVPPWSVSTVAQMAACVAMRETAYYSARWAETAGLRETLASGLRGLGWTVHPSTGNFLLCRIPDGQGSASGIAQRTAASGVFLRQTTGMGVGVGDRHLRVAVRSAGENARVLQVLATAIRPRP